MKSFSPPTQEEALQYAIEMGFHDPQEMSAAFWDYFVSIGWIVGKKRTPMKDWKAAMRTWNRNAKQYAKEKGINLQVVPKPRGGYVTKSDKQGEAMPKDLKSEIDSMFGIVH